ncbi:MAG: hemolysin family protein [Tissierella sp.]|uniref:hemolysin family protein n=1 Tax=Tissierella sp. TaxID=41274 RepID=UPI003F9C5D39
MGKNNLAIQLILILFLTILNAFFAASEMAIVSTNKKKIKNKAEKGDKKAKMLLQILHEPSKFLSTIQVGITFAGFFSSASAAVGISDDLGKTLTSIGIPFGKDIAFIGVTLLLSYIILVFGELVPKRIALQDAEKFAMIAIKPINIFAKLMKPFVSFLSFSTNTLIRLLGFNNESVEEKVTLEEIKSLVNVGQKQGVINPIEREMIDSVITFDDRVAKEIMTDRTEVLMIDINESKDINLDKMLNFQYSRVPVFKDYIDNIIGVLYLKDYLLHAYETGFKDINIKDVMRSPYFVPEYKNVNDLFLELQKTRNHFAILIDEYGGFAGIVTMEDIIEEIVGEIEDEYDYESEIKRVDKNVYYTKGSVTIKDLKNRLDLKLDEDPEHYDSLGGFLIHLLGHIPKAGEENIIKYKNIEFKIEKIRKRKIKNVKITIVKDEEENK